MAGMNMRRMLKFGIALVVAAATVSCASGNANRSAEQPADAIPITNSATRTLTELQLAFDTRKEHFYGPIEAFLDRNPGSDVTLILSITVEPDGSISDCHLVSSTFRDASLEAAIISEATRLMVGARSVPTATFPSYPIYVHVR